MKACTQFHVVNLERGDQLELIKDSVEGESIFATVSSAFRTGRFGVVIRTTDHRDLYVDDYDIIRLAEVAS